MEVKIKNITVSVDGQDFSFTHKSLVETTVYDPAKDPEVQGPGIADTAPVITVEAVPSAETTTDGITASADVNTEGAEVEVTSQPTE